MLALSRHLALAIVLCCCIAGYGDTITLSPASRGGVEYQVEGTILDYRGDAIIVARPQGSEKKYPAQRVVRIDTTWPIAYQKAEQEMAQLAWASAAEQLLAANREENRNWAKRLLLTDLMRCRMALGQWEAAGDLFLAIYGSDPQTPALHEAPLPWFTADYVRAQKAGEWLAAPANTAQPAARLLGASWLLATSKRDTARQTLVELAKLGPPQLTALAEGQLWRLGLVTVRPEQAEAWGRRITTFPSALRSGPQHVLAQAYLRLARYDEAALLALEGPLSGTTPRELNARCLLLAAKATHKAGYADESARLLQEVRNRYRDTQQRHDAEGMLRSLPAR